MSLKYIIGILATLCCGPVVADTMVATCSEPRGWRVDFGETQVSSGKGPEEDTDGFTGSKPQFIYDSSNPTVLTEVTDPINVTGVSPSVVEKLMPSEIKRYQIVAVDAKFIFAIDRGENSLWTFALYPDLGFLVITRNTAWGFPRGENAVGASYYAQCKITRG